MVNDFFFDLSGVIGRVYVSARDKMKQGGIHRIRRSRQCTDAAEAEVRCGF